MQTYQHTTTYLHITQLPANRGSGQSSGTTSPRTRSEPALITIRSSINRNNSNTTNKSNSNIIINDNDTTTHNTATTTTTTTGTTTTTTTNKNNNNTHSNNNTRSQHGQHQNGMAKAPAGARVTRYCDMYMYVCNVM